MEEQESKKEIDFFELFSVKKWDVAVLKSIVEGEEIIHPPLEQQTE